MSRNQDIKHYLIDIENNTKNLREKPWFKQLRAALKMKGFSVGEVLLAGYLEDEEGVAVGAIVCKNKNVYEFKFTDEMKAITHFERVSRLESIETYISAIHVAVDCSDELFKKL